MRKSIKSFISAALAGTIALTSAVSAAGSYKIQSGETHQVIVGFLHGDTGESFNAGYDFVASGLKTTNGAVLTASNFVKLCVKTEDIDNTHATAQIAYCINPSMHIDPATYVTSPNGYTITTTDDISDACGIHANNFVGIIFCDLLIWVNNNETIFVVIQICISNNKAVLGCQSQNINITINGNRT